MSYLFDAANEKMTATFAGTYAATCTLAMYIKLANHPAATGCCLANFGKTSNSVTDSLYLRIAATDNQWGARYTDPIPSSDTALRVQNIDNTWTPFVGTFPSASSRLIRVGAYTNSASASAARTASADQMKYLRIGEALDTGEDLGSLVTTYVAEIAIWNSILSQTDIESYMAGTSADQIAAANLIGYWPLNASASVHTNLGVGSMTADLTVSGTTYNADHPTITSPSTGQPTMGRCIYILP